MILLQSTLDTWTLHAAWFFVVLMAFGAGSIVGALRPKERLAEVVKRLWKLELRVVDDDHRVTLAELRLLQDFAETGE